MHIWKTLKNYSQRIDAEAKVLKMEQELSAAKTLQLQLSAKTSFLVSDIRKVGCHIFSLFCHL